MNKVIRRMRFRRRESGWRAVGASYAQICHSSLIVYFDIESADEITVEVSNYSFGPDCYALGKEHNEWNLLPEAWGHSRTVPLYYSASALLRRWFPRAKKLYVQVLINA